MSPQQIGNKDEFNSYHLFYRLMEREQNSEWSSNKTEVMERIILQSTYAI